MQSYTRILSQTLVMLAIPQQYLFTLVLCFMLQSGSKHNKVDPNINNELQYQEECKLCAYTFEQYNL